MKSLPAPDKKMLERMQDNTLAFFEKWMSLNWAISFLTTLEYCGFGYKRANELLDAIEKEWARHDDYDNYDYSIEHISKELEKRGIDAESIFKKSLGIKDSKHREKKRHQKKESLTLLQQLQVKKDVEKLIALRDFVEKEDILKK